MQGDVKMDIDDMNSDDDDFVDMRGSSMDVNVDVEVEVEVDMTVNDMSDYCMDGSLDVDVDVSMDMDMDVDMGSSPRHLNSAAKHMGIGNVAYESEDEQDSSMKRPTTIMNVNFAQEERKSSGVRSTTMNKLRLILAMFIILNFLL